MACATRLSTRRDGALSLPLTSPGCSSATAPPAAASTMAEPMPKVRKLRLCMPLLWHSLGCLRSLRCRGFPAAQCLRSHPAQCYAPLCRTEPHEGVQASINTGNAAESMAAPGVGPPEGGGGGDIKPLRNTKRASAPVKRAEKARRRFGLALAGAPCTVRP
jgi:hypothetical protein